MDKYTKAVLAVVAITLASGCASTRDPISDDLSYKPEKMTIEGVDIYVKKMKGNNAWRATEDDIWRWAMDPNIYRRNVLAIEKVTNCKVDRASILNFNVSTSATVICD